MKPSPDEGSSSPGTPSGPGSGAAYAERTGRALAAGLRLQTGVAVVLALALLPLGPVAAYSSLCGSLAVWIPGLMFTVLVGRRIGGDSATFLKTAVLAEFGKMFLIGGLCAAVFIWVRPLAAGWFFAGMIAVLVTGWIGLGRAIR